MRTRSVIPAAVLLCGCSLHHQPVGPEPLRGPARDSLLQLDQTRGDTAVARGRASGLLALMDTDVVFLRAGIPAVYGRDAVRTVLLVDPEPPQVTLGWQPLGGGVSADLRSGYTFGIAARAGGPRGPIRLERYIAFWRRAAAAPWRIIAYAEVGGPPAGGPPALRIHLPSSATTLPARQLPQPQDKARAQMRAADSVASDLAYRLGVGYAFSNTIAPDGAMFGGETLVLGPAAARDFYALRGESSLTWKPVDASVAASGDLGFTIGQSVNTIRGPSGAAVQRLGKYLTVWQRQRDGNWKFVISGENAMPSADPR